MATSQPEPTARPRASLWTDLGDAIRGSHHDYTKEPIGRAILLLAVPMVLEMVMESLFAVVDVFWVSRLGADAVATIGLTESVLVIIYALAIGLCIGGTATVARRIGEKNPDGAAIAAVQAILIGIAVSVAIGIFGFLLAHPLLALMGASATVIGRGHGYTEVMLAGNSTVFLLFLVNAIFRGAGDPSVAMRVLWLANGINLVLDPCLIFGLGPFPELGVAGAAVATNVGRGTAVIYQLVRLARGTSHLRVEPRHLRVNRPVMISVLRLSGTGTLQSLINTTSWLGLVRILSTFGSAALAGYTIGIRIIIFAILPSWGLSNAAATMVGQNLGAGRPERAERAVWLAGFYNMIFLGAVGLVFVVFAEPLILFFTSDPQVVPYGVRCLRIVSYGFLFYAYGMVLTNSFNGAGDTWTPTLINLFCFWLWEVPLAYALAKPLGYGPSGVFTAITVAFSSLAVISAIVFRRGRWKKKQV